MTVLSSEALPDASSDGDATCPDETTLWTEVKAHASGPARERLFLLHLPLARSIAAQLFAGRPRHDVEFQDFYQLASIGLLEAIDRFDPTRGVTFPAFCRLRIHGHVLSGVEKLTDGQEQLSLQRRIRRERVASLNRPADGERREEDTLSALGALAAGLAIGFMLEDTGMLADTPNKPSPYGNAYQSLAWSQTKARLHDAVGQLPARTQRIIHYHYYLGLSFEPIGTILGLTKGRISQLHRSALIDLRQAMRPDQNALIIS